MLVLKMNGLSYCTCHLLKSHNINKDLLWAQNGYVNVADTGLSQTFCFG